MIGESPDAALALVGHAAGGGGGGEIAVLVERDRADRALRADERRSEHAVARPTAARTPAASCWRLGRCGSKSFATSVEAFFERELLRPRAHQQHVPRLLHHAPRQIDRILHVPHRRDGACALLLPVHHRGIELRPAVARERRATTGVEQRIVFERAHREASPHRDSSRRVRARCSPHRARR